jgi:hypothetical protein
METKPMTAAEARRLRRTAEREMAVAREVAASGHSSCLGCYTTEAAAKVALAGHGLFDRDAG